MHKYIHDYMHKTSLKTPRDQLEAVNQRTNGQKDKNIDLQNTTKKTKDRAPLKTGVNSCAPEGSTISAPLATVVVLLLNDRFNYE